MQVACAWCGKPSLEPSETSPGPISHGICVDCMRALLAENAESLQAYLDRFTTPIVLMDGQARIRGLNEAARPLLPEQSVGVLGGHAFQCVFSELPGGCGGSIHCRTCTIRRTVVHTAATGKPHIREPALLDLYRELGDETVQFHISTEKIGEAVWLRIDSVSPLGPNERIKNS